MTSKHEAKVAGMIRNLEAKTGRTLEDWIAVLHEAGPASGHKARVDWLKTTHGLGHFQAKLVVSRADAG